MAKDDILCRIKFMPSDADSPKLKMYADAAVANKEYLSSQLGHIIILFDATNRCHIWTCRERNQGGVCVPS